MLQRCLRKWYAESENCCCWAQENISSGTASVTDVPLVHIHHFEQALQRVVPSVSRKDQKVYEALRWQLRSSRGHLNPQVLLSNTGLPSPMQHAGHLERGGGQLGVASCHPSCQAALHLVTTCCLVMLNCHIYIYIWLTAGSAMLS